MKKYNFFQKIGTTLMMVMMSPMLMDNPTTTKESAKKMFWCALKKLWKEGEL